MKYLNEFRQKKLVDKLTKGIGHLMADIDRKVILMEVCGTHTMAAFRYGIKDLLPANLHLLSGPGCPVCVTANDYLDKAIAYARKEGVIVATFGDMVKVPGSSSSLAEEASNGAEIRVVYSSLEALKIAHQNPESSNWRGIGEIEQSGFKIREKYESFDAKKKYPVSIEKSRDNPECICGDILRGLKTPLDCRLFRKVCHPSHPVGACMVSAEGTCAAYYKYSSA